MEEARGRKIAAAPISWGVCEADNWGLQLPAGHVLSEMHSLGISAIERGPDGFLPDDPDQARQLVAEHGLSIIGGFFPCHISTTSNAAGLLAEAIPTIEALEALSAQMLVIALVSGDGAVYDNAQSMSDSEWDQAAAGLQLIRARAAKSGIQICVHPHAGTLVETPAQIHRLLAETDEQICLDTGHIMVGGGDVLDIVGRAAPRIAHVHLKDVHRSISDLVATGAESYSEAVRRGMYCPAGSGDAHVAEVVHALDAAGYDGWYVLEQDVMLSGDGADSSDIVRAVEASMRFIHDV